MKNQTNCYFRKFSALFAFLHLRPSIAYPSQAAFSTYLIRLCTRTVLLAYGLLMFKPVMPLVADFLAHRLWAHVHFATVHKHGGEEHVHYELRKAAKEECEHSGSKRQTDTDNIVHTLAAAPVLPHAPLPLAHRRATTAYIRHYPAVSGLPDYPPPKAA